MHTIDNVNPMVVTPQGVVSMRRFRLALLSLCAVGFVSAQEPEPVVSVQVVKYDGLTKTVRQNLGQVVVLDFWGIT